jgi:hypothetical protein
MAVFYNLDGRHESQSVLSLWRRDPVHNRWLQPINYNLFYFRSSQEPNYNFDDLNPPGFDDRVRRAFHFNQLEVNQVVELYAAQRNLSLYHNQAGYLALSIRPREPEMQNAAIQPAAPAPAPAPADAAYDISALLADANLKEDATADPTADATADATKRDPLRAWSCSICLQGIQEDRMLVAAHGEHVVPVNHPDAGQHLFHVFHRACLAKWEAMGNKKCPTCNQPLCTKPLPEVWSPGNSTLNAPMALTFAPRALTFAPRALTLGAPANPYTVQYLNQQSNHY